MKLIQLILFPALLILVVIYFRRLRTLLLDRLIVLIVGSTALLLVLMPDWTSQLAHKLGVGRGVDLIFYLAFFGVGFFCLMLWTKLRDLEARLTALARDQALKDFREPHPK